jgi:uncharacterized protein YceH (UPF0502 family)
MPPQFDRTEQRILGVLVEKELSVPETYPLTINALQAGCNQKSNRDPFMQLEEFEIEGAVMNLCLRNMAIRREGSRATRYAHRLDERLSLDQAGKAIIAELFLRGPQTPMELKNRIGRMGVHLDAGEIESRLTALAARGEGGLVQLLPRQPRERDARWTHLLGPAAPRDAAEQPEPAAATPAERAPRAGDLAGRVADLEVRVARLEARLGRGEEAV